MAVDAQHPFNIILSDLIENRVPQANLAFMAPGLPELELHQQATTLQHVYNPGIDPKGLYVSNGSRSLKQPKSTACGSRLTRLRVTEESIARKRASTSLPRPQQQKQITSNPSLAIAEDTLGLLGGLPVSHTNSRANLAMSTATEISKPFLFPSILKEELQSEVMKEIEEMNHFIMLQAEQLKQALQQTRQRSIRHLLAAFEGVLKRLNQKDAELVKLNCKNLELEEHVKQLTFQSILWKNMAKHNEMTVSSLKRSMEQIVEPDDAKSCNQNTEIGDILDLTVKEDKKLKEQRSCRVCRINETCLLLLPCRHLCLCKDCESMLDSCPICKSLKNASVEVYVS